MFRVDISFINLSWWPEPLELAVGHSAYRQNTKIKEQQGWKHPWR